MLKYRIRRSIKVEQVNTCNSIHILNVLLRKTGQLWTHEVLSKDNEEKKYPTRSRHYDLRYSYLILYTSIIIAPMHKPMEKDMENQDQIPELMKDF